MRLEKKVAVVTGAGKGIGKAIALKFAEEGAVVIVNDVDLSSAEVISDMIKVNGGTSVAIQADVSAWCEVDTMFDRIARDFKRVDILVNNAGVREDMPFFKISENDWIAAFSVQLNGSFNCSRAVQRYMVPQKYGKIVNLSSPFPASLGYRSQTGYAAACAAVEGLTKSLSIELGNYNINVNCVAPDYIDTEMIRKSARKEGLYIEDFRRLAIAQIPLRRIGKAEDVSNLVLFLVSDDSSFISGQVINVKGGP